MRPVVAGGDDQAGGAFVEAVDYAGPLLSPGGRPAAAQAEQRVDQRARVVTRCGVHDHARGLVDDDQVGVLIDEPQGERLRPRSRGMRFGDGELDDVASGHAIRGVRRLAVEPDPPVLYQPGRGRAAQRRRVLSQKPVKTRGRRGRRQALFGLRSTYPSRSRTTPVLTAESATLNTGQKCTATKSVTVPNMKRSKRLPTVPPSTRPSTRSAGTEALCVNTYAIRPHATPKEAIRKTIANAGARPNAAPELWMFVIDTRWSIAGNSVPEG